MLEIVPNVNMYVTEILLSANTIVGFGSFFVYISVRVQKPGSRIILNPYMMWRLMVQPQVVDFSYHVQNNVSATRGFM